MICEHRNWYTESYGGKDIDVCEYCGATIDWQEHKKDMQTETERRDKEIKDWQKQIEERVKNSKLKPQPESQDPDGEYEASRDREDRDRYEAERQYFEK